MIILSFPQKERITKQVLNEDAPKTTAGQGMKNKSPVQYPPHILKGNSYSYFAPPPKESFGQGREVSERKTICFESLYYSNNSYT